MTSPVHNRADLVGQRFGRLMVVELVGPVRYAGRFYSNWLCKCDCGKLSIRLSTHLLHGVARSCGCLANENRRTGRRIDLTGARFGRLTVVRFADGFKRASWECECSCKNKRRVVVSSDALRRGITRSCGCLRQGGKPSPRPKQ